MKAMDDIKAPTKLQTEVGISGDAQQSGVEPQATLVKVTQTSATSSTACVLTQASAGAGGAGSGCSGAGGGGGGGPLLPGADPDDPSKLSTTPRHVSL